MKNNETITQRLEYIWNEICTHYCKYPDQYGHSDEELDKLCHEHCDNCPLMEL